MSKSGAPAKPEAPSLRSESHGEADTEPSITPLLLQLEDIMRDQAPGLLSALNPPATPRQIVEFRRSIGIELPDCFYEFYAWHDGSDDWDAFYRGLDILPLESVLSSKKMMDGLEEDGSFDRWGPDEWWDRGWVPFMSNHSYDELLIDPTGAKGGTPGQILWWSKDDPSTSVIALSMHQWLEAIVEALEVGILCFGERGLEETSFDVRVSRGEDEAQLITWDHILDGLVPTEHPQHFQARSRRELGLTRQPKPPTIVMNHTDDVLFEVSTQVWAPAEAHVHALAYIPGDDLLAVAQAGWESPGLSLVSPETGVIERVLHGPDPDGGNDVYRVLYLAQSHRLAYLHSTSYYRELCLYDIATDQHQVLLPKVESRMADFLSCDTRGGILTCASDEGVRLFHIGEGGEVFSLALDVPEPMGCTAAVHPDGNVVIVARPRKPYLFFDAANGSLMQELSIPLAEDGSVYWLPSGALLKLEGHTPYLWDLNAERHLHLDATERGLSTFVHACDPQRRYLALAGYASAVNVYDLHTGAELFWDNAEQARVYGLAFDAQGERLFSAGDTGQIVTRTLRPR